MRHVLDRLIFEIEAPEREVQNVLRGLVSTVEASERKQALMTQGPTEALKAGRSFAAP